MPSISFDRAVDYYDATRGFPPGIGDAVAQAALAWLPPNARVLEIGVGTGRIAKPLLARGVNLTGIDLSRNMMGRLRATMPADAPPPALVEGDATALPFPTASFDAAVSVHVFHLIAHWQTALAEVQRVLRPGGVLLSGYDRRGAASPSEALRRQWQVIVAARGIDNLPGAHDFADVDALLRASGAIQTEQTVGAWTSTKTIAAHIETVEHRTWSSAWEVPDEFFPACLAELRAWAVNTYGSLEAPFTNDHTFVWQRYRWPNADQRGL